MYMNKETSSINISEEKEHYNRKQNKNSSNNKEFSIQDSNAKHRTNIKSISTKDFSKKLTVILFILIVLLQIVVRVFVGYRKEYFHMDEAYSYGLMNYNKIEITNNSDFYDTWHSKDYYKDYFVLITHHKHVYYKHLINYQYTFHF